MMNNKSIITSSDNKVISQFLVERLEDWFVELPVRITKEARPVYETTHKALVNIASLSFTINKSLPDIISGWKLHAFRNNDFDATTVAAVEEIEKYLVNTQSDRVKSYVSNAISIIKKDMPSDKYEAEGFKDTINQLAAYKGDLVETAISFIRLNIEFDKEATIPEPNELKRINGAELAINSFCQVFKNPSRIISRSKTYEPEERAMGL